MPRKAGSDLPAAKRQRTTTLRRSHGSDKCRKNREARSSSKFKLPILQLSDAIQQRCVAAIGPNKFDPAKTFRGARPGTVFKLGEQGLGYYSDRGSIAVMHAACMQCTACAYMLVLCSVRRQGVSGCTRLSQACQPDLPAPCARVRLQGEPRATTAAHGGCGSKLQFIRDQVRQG